MKRSFHLCEMIIANRGFYLFIERNVNIAVVFLLERNIVRIFVTYNSNKYKYSDMDMINFDGLLIGIVTFLIIGLFHPVVVKAEYYWGTKCWWIFLVLGILGVIASLFIDSVFVSAICGVFAFSSFWTIKEIFEQEERVQKGWFPRNPKRKYPWDDSEVK